MNSMERKQNEADCVKTRDDNLAGLYVPPKLEKMQPLAQVTGTVVITGHA